MTTKRWLWVLLLYFATGLAIGYHEGLRDHVAAWKYQVEHGR